MSMKRTVMRYLIGALVAGLLFVSCASDGDESSTTSVLDETSTTSSPTTVTIPDESATTEATDSRPDDGDDVAGEEWTLDSVIVEVFEILNGREFTEEQFEDLFSPVFTSQIPYRDFVGLTNQLVVAGPWSEIEELDHADTFAELLVEDAKAARWVLTVELGGTPTQVMGLLLAPVPEAVEVADFDDAVRQLEELGIVRLSVADTSTGSCQSLDQIRAQEQAPLGSVFKLYVLGAVITKIDAGELAWDDLVEIRDELDSIPSGTTQEEEPGTLLSVRELADRMIAISDNTATDHLIDLVGREAVEQAVSDFGHADPSVNRPFMTTREFTIMKFGGTEETRAAYIAADEDGRRDLLPDLTIPLPSVLAITSATVPIEVESLEWFGSPVDMCNVLVKLVAHPVAREVLGQNPGTPDVAGAFDYVGFKGGSEPGVLAVAWWVETSDGQSFAITGAVSSETFIFSEIEAIGVLSAVRDSVATQE